MVDGRAKLFQGRKRETFPLEELSASCSPEQLHNTRIPSHSAWECILHPGLPDQQLYAFSVIICLAPIASLYRWLISSCLAQKRSYLLRNIALIARSLLADLAR